MGSFQSTYIKREGITMPHRDNCKEQTSFQYILEEDSRQEAKQRENERRLLAALNSCSRESKQKYAEILRH
jgi:hypothetical protein